MTESSTAVELPAPGRYRLAPERSVLSFTTRHVFGLASVRGTFDLTEGHIEVADPVTDSTVSATISASSFTTPTAARDKVVRSALYLDTARHPDITFTSAAPEQVGDRWAVPGSLTVRGRTSPIEVRVTELRPEHAGLSLRAESRIDRYAFGITATKGMLARYLTVRLNIVADRDHD